MYAYARPQNYGVYVHLWILNVFSDFFDIIYAHTATNGTPESVHDLKLLTVTR